MKGAIGVGDGGRRLRFTKRQNQVGVMRGLGHQLISLFADPEADIDPE